ncbi:MAG: Hint domain-containing protein [Maritimibacter sp.]
MSRAIQNVLPDDLPVRHLSVYVADGFRVTHGVNEGDALTDASDLLLEDIYELDAAAPAARLSLAMGEDARDVHLTGESGLGTPGAPVFLDSLVTFMDPDGETLEALVLVEVDAPTGTISEVYLHPLGAIHAKTPYTLVTIDTQSARERLAQSASVSFTRSTHITMADGRQKPIEDLVVGDKVLTRDSGPQEVRWVGMQTLRATGAFAPVMIEKGALNNTRALTVSPNHRLFIYQRFDALGTGKKELLVKAGLLVNGTSVVQNPGGYVDYVQVLFDKHEIIYAEGIASETFFADTTTRPALPDAVAKRLGLARSNTQVTSARELGEADLSARRDAVDMLRIISTI